MVTDLSSNFIAVLGGGVMGTGIAAMALGHGQPVLLVDLDEKTLTQSRLRIDKHLRHAQLLSAFPTGRLPATLRTSTSIAEVAGAIAVVEAVTENIGLKREVLKEVSQAVSSGTPLISNTSSIPIDELADGLPRPADLAGVHFMNPAHLITMVEVIEGPRTARNTMEALLQLLEDLRRRPVVVRDAPGFVTSRLLHPMINDAIQIVESGITSVESTDLLMQGCLGHPSGPLRTADLIGLDNLADSLVALHERTGDDRFRPSKLLLQKVEKGHLGRKSGRGFYEYEEVFS